MLETGVFVVLCDNRTPVLVKAAVRSAITYGSQCWPLKKQLVGKLHTTEMRIK